MKLNRKIKEDRKYNMKIDKQIEKVYEDIINKLYKDAYSTQSCANYLMTKYKLNKTRAYNIIRKSKEYFGKFIIDSDDTLLQECIEILKYNREKAAEQNNLKEVRECTKEIGKLMQLYTQSIELNASINIEQPLLPPLNTDEEGGINEN